MLISGSLTMSDMVFYPDLNKILSFLEQDFIRILSRFDKIDSLRSLLKEHHDQKSFHFLERFRGSRHIQIVAVFLRGSA